MKLSLNAFALCLTIAAAGPAAASAITVTNDASGLGRTTFGATDTVNWGALGTNFTVVSSPFNIDSAGGLGVTVSEPNGTFQRRDLHSGWGGNFTDGSSLLWTGGTNTAQVSFAFATLLSGIGFQINPDYAETTTVVDVYGAGNALFGSYTLTTNDRTQAGASFLGFTSDLADIASITVRQVGGRSDFAVNQLSLKTDSNGTLPEPSSLLLAGLALTGLGLSRRSKR